MFSYRQSIPPYSDTERPENLFYGDILAVTGFLHVLVHL